MTTDVSISHEKSKIGALVNALIILLAVYVAFFVLSAVCFALLDFSCRIGIIEHKDSLHINWMYFITNPVYIFKLYGCWWNLLVKGIVDGGFRFVLITPFFVPAGMVLSGIYMFLQRKYSFVLWYVINHHFAKKSDVENMGLSKGVFMMLGRFGGELLGVKPSESVLCIGEMGTGKTSSVAIPSVLHSDNACLICVDMTGLLPKYTAGKRARLGKTFYFNWDLEDDADKEMFYPRWNPLCSENMPKDVAERDAYIKRIASYLIDVNEVEKDDYWNILANSIIVAILAYWVAKVSQAKTNDYFLNKLVEGRHLTSEEKKILMSYYTLMQKSYAKGAVEALKDNSINQDSYVPIGSWGGIPEQWIGKDVCFAAITDWIINNYISSRDDNSKDWKSWFESLLREAVFFGYGDLAINGIRQILALSTKQRQLAFTSVMKPFKIFTNQALRERTNGNDLNINDIRGIYDEKAKKWRPITIYSLANNYNSKILNQMFLDEVLYRNLNQSSCGGAQGILPLILVLDDVGHNLKLKNLTTLLEKGKSKKMSALLLCNSMNLVENTYSKKELESVVVNTAYKIVKAPDNIKLSRQLDKLATFATKSVQIPKAKGKKRKMRKKYFADASYFHRLALDFRLSKRIKIDTRSHQIVLAEGYYHRPILAENVFFAEDEKFSRWAVLDADYTVERPENITDNELYTPKISEIFDNNDLGMDDVVQLDQYMSMVFDEAEDEKKKKHEAMKKENEAFEENSKNQDNDWWLDEDAFGMEKNEEKNPFKEKNNC
ncbi:MAG: type IV secretory system conjugative DNA transfer family protein [Alphaproteobacteria bacterium]|nr:type IV secretory system conjugative DNA transfer family protein [Alphaproteobacteria bacterium]